MRKIPRNAICETIIALLEAEAKRATKYVAHDLVVSAQRKTYKASFHRMRKNERSIDVTVKIGAPNYVEREFIAAHKGEKFPIQAIQLKYIDSARYKQRFGKAKRRARPRRK